MNFFSRSGNRRTLLLLATAVCVSAGAAVGQTDITEKFKDAEFRAVVYREIGKAAPAPILDSDVSDITSLSIHSKYSVWISDLSGIEYFTALTVLYCNDNQLTALDVSKNTALGTLYCSNNKLTTLDVSKNTALKVLYCNDNQLTALDVSKNTALGTLYCNYNKLTTLDVSTNLMLEYLYCSVNQLTTLDVSKNTALTKLDCWSNQLTTLDVSKNTALTYLDCWSNQLTTLDVSKNTALTDLSCSENQLTTLDVSKNTALTKLDCWRNQLTTLDVSKNTALTWLDCNGNQLTTLDVSKNTALRALWCFSNQLTTLDVSKNTALGDLICRGNRLTTLDVSKNTALDRLVCNENQLTTLDVSKNTALTWLDCNGNQLTTLDVSKNTALTDLYCLDNQLTTLDVSKNTALTRLWCGNQIRSGYIFDGWYKDAALINPWNGSVSTNLTLYAKWTLNNTYTITWNTDGGTPAPTQTSVNHGNSITAPGTMTKTGYSFDGWYTNYGLTTAATFPMTNVTESKTFYAKWTLNSYPVTWNTDGGTPTPTQTSVNYGSSITAPTAMTKTGHIFGGWYTNSDLTAAATFPIENVTTSKTFYAKWIATYTITFDANGGTVTPSSGTTGSNGTLTSLPTPSRNGYAFNGWFTSETGGEKVTESRKYSANTTIYAQWTQSAYTVMLDPAGGTVTPTTVSIGENKRVVSLPTPTRTNYTFDGWFTAPTSGEKVTEGYILSENITVYARWTSTYAITFGAATNGAITATVDGSPITTGTSVQYGKNVVFTAVPDMGYDVGGWMVNGTLVAEATNKYTLLNVSSTAVVTVSFNLRVIDAVASPDRVIPAVRPGNGVTAISPVPSLTAAFTAGPNPALRSSGTINFFRSGPRISPASLSIYDASGNVVCKVALKDAAPAVSNGKRPVGSWNMKDANGRPVPEGAYLVRGVVKAKAGKSERVSLVVGVR
jgi:uncharacterized repeat protein (TIGR02543 family)